MAKRKAETTASDAKAEPASKIAKKTATEGADKIGLTYKDFEKTAPNLSLKLLELKDTKNNGSSSSSSQETEILSLDLSKTEMKTGSYGYSSAGKRIMIEVEVDGKKKKVPALVSVNITVVGSKKKASD